MSEIMPFFERFLNPTTRAYYLIRILLCFALGLAIYYQTFSFDFVFDDIWFIVNNPYIKDIKEVHHVWEGLPKSRLIGIYTFVFNYAIGKFNPAGYHIFNLVVHFLATGVVWLLSRKIFNITGWLQSDDKKREEAAFFIALLFLVHPGQTQAVTYITQRYESIAALFYLATTYCYLKARTVSDFWLKLVLFLSALILGLLGIFTKETAVTIPLMLLACEFIIFDYKSNKQKGLKYLIICGVFTVFVLIMMKNLQTGFADFLNFSAPSKSHDGDIITFNKYILSQMRVFLTFLSVLIFPVSQNLDYDFPLSTGLFNPPLTAVGILVIGIFGLMILILRKTKPLIAFGLAWILITFSINLYPRIFIIFEHKLYLISFGFLLTVVVFLAGQIKNAKILFGLLTVLVLIFSIAAYKRNHVWQNELTLWEDVVPKSPAKANAYNGRGIAYSHAGQTQKAIADFTKAIKLDPHYANAYYNRAREYATLGAVNKAITEYDKAIELSPPFPAAIYHKALLFFDLGQVSKAEDNLNKAIKLRPNFALAYFSLGSIYANQKEYIKALTALSKAIEINPDLGSAYFNRAKLYWQLKQYANAKKDYLTSQKFGYVIDPKFLAALN